MNSKLINRTDKNLTQTLTRQQFHAQHMDPIQTPTSPPRTFPATQSMEQRVLYRKCQASERRSTIRRRKKKNRLNPPNYSAHTKTREHIRINSPPPPTENHQIRKHTRFAPEMKPTQILCRLFNPCPVQELPQANRNKNQEDTSSTTDSCFLTQHRGPGNWDTSISGR